MMEEQDFFANSRLRILSIILIVLFSALGIRLFQRQVLQSGYYKALAKKQYTVSEQMPAKRGQIFMADGWNSEGNFPIATNITLYAVMAIPKNVTNKNEVAQKLATILNLKADDIYNEINNDKPYIPPIKRKVDYDQAKQVEDLNINGVYLNQELWRYYPENELACHVLGFVDAENNGQYGLEGYYNSELAGQPYDQLTYQDELGQYQDTISPGNSLGSDLYLTIDRNVQYQAMKYLQEAVKTNQAESGSLIIQDPKTGAILGMVSYPNYNSNDFDKVQDVSLFKNACITNSYEPGSVFKVLTMAAAIDKGVVQPETTGDFGSSVVVQNYTINNAANKMYGHETMTQVLQNSDNVGMVWVESKLGNDAFYNYINNYGFGQKTGIDLDTEEIGQVLPFKDWHQVSGATMAFGQGISVTPIQLITAISSIANNGKLMKPYVVNKIKNSQTNSEIEIKPSQVRQVVSPDAANKVAQMMQAVVDTGQGQAAKIKGYTIAGKTGTAQIANPNGPGYLENQNIGSFAGFFPVSNPKISMLVRIDRPKSVAWAEESATPYFEKMADWLIKYYQIPPDRNN